MDTALFRKPGPPLPPRNFGRYSLAVVASLLASLLTIFLVRHAEQGVFVLFFGAVFVSAHFGGFGPGLTATALTSLVAAVVVMPHLPSFSSIADEILPVLLYAAISVLTTTILTKLRRTTQNLREKEEHLSDFIEEATVGMNWVADDGTIIWANKAELGLLGYRSADYIGHNLRDFCVDAPVAEDLMGRLARHETFQNLEARLRAQDGTFRTVLLHSNVYYRDGRYVRARCFTQDVTARKAAELEVHHRARQQETVAALGQVALTSDDPQSLLQEAVKRVKDTLHLDYCEVLEFVPGAQHFIRRAAYGQQDNDGTMEVLARDLQSETGFAFSSEKAVVIENIKTEARFDISPRLRQEQLLSGACLRISSRECAYGVLGMYSKERRTFSSNEIHFGQAVAHVLSAALERQASEEILREREYLLRRVLDTNPNFIMVKDSSGVILLANQALAASYQLELDEVVGRSHLELHRQLGMDPTEVQQWLADDLEVIRSGRPKVINEVFTHRDGSLHWYSTRKLPFHMADKLPCVLIISEDITERKAARDELNRLNAELERRVIQRTSQLEMANKELEAFSYSISHDLRAPLRAIHGFAQIIREDYAPDLDMECLRLLDIIANNTKRMGQLIEDLLAFSRVSRIEMARVPVDMETVMRNVVQECALAEPERAGQISVGPLCAVRGDPALLQQVFLNLLTNALKFTRPIKEPRIEVGCEKTDTEIIYAVRDNGVGFDMKYAHKLFKVFQRLHKMEHFEGTGVGLAIIHRIITRQGGRAWAEATVGGGAAFFIALPIEHLIANEEAWACENISPTGKF